MHLLCKHRVLDVSGTRSKRLLLLLCCPLIEVVREILLLLLPLQFLMQEVLDDVLLHLDLLL